MIVLQHHVCIIHVNMTLICSHKHVTSHELGCYFHGRGGGVICDCRSLGYTTLSGILTWYCLNVYGTTKLLIYSTTIIIILLLQRQCFFCLPTTEMSIVLLTARKCYRAVCFICLIILFPVSEAIQVLHNAMGVYGSAQISLSKVHAPILLPLSGGRCLISRKKRYVTLEWPLSSCQLPFLHS